MSKRLEVIVGFFIIILIGVGLWFGIKSIVTYFKNSDTQLVASIITASATILVGIGAVIISQNRIKSREIEEAHRESKIELYTRFNSFLVRVLQGSESGSIGARPDEQEMMNFMIEFKRDLIFRASPEVIKTLLNYTHNENKDKVLILMNDLLLAMRKDIGLKNDKMDNFELIQIFLKDRNDVKKLKR